MPKRQKSGGRHKISSGNFHSSLTYVHFSCTKDSTLKMPPTLRHLHYVVKVSNGCRSQMADRILKFMIGHLGLGSNVQLDLVDFKVCDWPPETSLNGQSQTLKSSWPIKTSLSWLITKL